MIIVGLFNAKNDLELFKNQVTGLTNLELHVLTVEDIWPGMVEYTAVLTALKSVEYGRGLTEKLKEFRTEDKNVLVLIWAHYGPAAVMPLLYGDVAFECMVGLTPPPLYKVVKQRPLDLNWPGHFTHQELIAALSNI
jgi:hypothetical protein